MKTSEVPALSPEKLKEYTILRDTYHKKRDEIKVGIKQHQTQISTHRTAIGELEKQIEESRPRVNEATKICEKCDIYSMVFEGIEPGQGGRERWYECIICKNVDYET